MSAAIRAKAVVSYWGGVIVLLLVAVGVLALAGAGFVYATPTTTTMTETVDEQTVSAGVETSARVTGNTTLYEPGTTLKDMSAYLFSATPNLTLTVRTEVPPDADAQVFQQLSLVLRAARDGEPFFTRNRTLLRNEGRAANGTAVSSATVNVSRVQGEVSATREEVGEVGSFRVLVRMTVAYRTGEYEGRLAASAPVQITGGAYWIDGSISDSRTHSRTVTRRVTEPPNPAVYLGLALVGILSLAGAGATERLRRDIDAEVLEIELYRSRYQEWISEGEFPTGTEKRYTSINSLEDLVDIAIDSDKRVIHDPDLDTYAVIDGDVVYYFSTDPFSIDAWLDT